MSNLTNLAMVVHFIWHRLIDKATCWFQNGRQTVWSMRRQCWQIDYFIGKCCQFNCFENNVFPNFYFFPIDKIKAKNVKWSASLKFNLFSAKNLALSSTFHNFRCLPRRITLSFHLPIWQLSYIIYQLP